MLGYHWSRLKAPRYLICQGGGKTTVACGVLQRRKIGAEVEAGKGPNGKCDESKRSDPITRLRREGRK